MLCLLVVCDSGCDAIDGKLIEEGILSEESCFLERAKESCWISEKLYLGSDLLEIYEAKLI